MLGMKAKLVFLHGLESGPQGSKYQALQELDTEMIAPNCQGINDIAERLQIIEDSLEGVERMVLVGSSFGGLAALLFAQGEHRRDRIAGCLLCAPAIPLAAPETIPWIPPNTVVLHGTDDDVIPHHFSRAFCEERGVRLVTVEDDHRLADSRELMVDLVRELMDCQD